MPLTLVLGPANSAKAGEVLGAYSTAAPRGGLLVVPTALDARHYAGELAGTGVVLGGVLTFSGLAREIARRSGYTARRLSDRQRERILDRVLGAAAWEAMASSAGAPGFTSAAGRLISELERGLVTPQRFAAALRAWSEADARRAPYARDVARVYGDYARELGRRDRLDRELYAWRALDALRAQPARWGTDPVFFYGFDDLTALERDAIETLARIAGAEVTVSLTYEPGREALVTRAEAVEELRPLADRVLELPALDEHYEPTSRAALHHLERSLFEAEPERVDPGAAVVLLESGGARAEAELVAGRVLGLLRDGVAGDEIVVVYRSLASAAPLVAAVFEQYGIALACTFELPLAHAPLGRALLGAARCALLDEGSAGAQDLLAYLRAPGVLERPEIADALEADSRREGLRTAAAARARLGWNLAELDALRTATDPGGELCRLARRLFAAPHRGAAPALTGPEELDGRALAAVVEAIDELAELGLPPAGAELISWLERLSFPAGLPEGPGRVRLAEPAAIRARRFRAVFVCGLQEGEFPRPARPEPFLSDERRRELASCSGLRLLRHEDGLARERYLFYASLSRATESVTLSYRSSDEEGNLALASPFVADVAELLAADWPARRVRRPLADVVWEPSQAPTDRERARALAAARAPRVGDEPEPDRSLGALALSRLRHTEMLSAGALENYGDCPVKWFVERELRPEALEPEPEPISRGNLMHAVLERLLGELEAPITRASVDRARELLGRVLAELSPTATLAQGQPEAVRRGALRAIEADLGRYLEHEASNDAAWRPAGLELRFGFPDTPEAPSLPALELGEGAERVLVRGMVDRVDVDSDGRAMVRDYKSGATRSNFPAARWAEDRRLQVALYMLVVRDLAGREAVAGFYQPLRGDDLRARGMYLEGVDVGSGTVATDARSAESFEAELQGAATRAVTLAAALRAGRLTPCPQNCSRDGCAYPGICRSR
jgi:RecB family exonuclease